MNYIALRTSGVSPSQPTAPVYATWDLAVAAVNALSPLSDDVNILVQGGQTFGQDNLLNALFNLTWNTYTCYIETDPGEISPTAYVKGLIKSIALTGARLHIRNIKVYGTYDNTIAVFGESSTNYPVIFENVFAAVKWNGTNCIFCRGSTPKIYNSTICLLSSGVPTNFIFSPITKANIYNTSILTHLVGNAQISAGGGGVAKNNNLYNFNASYNLTFSNPFTVTNPKDGNPNMVDTLIQSAGDSPDTIIARSAKLTASSFLCMDNADSATATLTDIEGNPRGGM